MFPNWIYYIIGKKSAGGTPTPSGLVVPNGLKFGYSNALPEDFENWDFSNVDDFSFYFNGSTLTSIPNIDISQTKSMKEFLENNKEIADITNLNMNFYKVNSFESCFAYCSKLKSVPTINIYGSYDNTITFDNCFASCSELVEINLNLAFNSPTTISSFSSLFNGCSKLERVNLSMNSNCVSKTNISYSYMFMNCSKIKDIPVFDFSTISNNSFYNMFYNCTSLTNQSLDNILQSCISGTHVSMKKLSYLGVNSQYDSIIPTLPHYQDFINAGWIIR